MGAANLSGLEVTTAMAARHPNVSSAPSMPGMVCVSADETDGYLAR